MPDSIFPNNWISTHRNLESKTNQSCIVTYRMMSENRQREFNPNIIKHLQPNYETHFSQLENSEGEVLEGTGVLVFDHSNRIVYLNESKRATHWGFDLFMESFD